MENSGADKREISFFSDAELDFGLEVFLKRDGDGDNTAGGSCGGGGKEVIAI